MITNCPVCGKAFDVLFTHLYRYKRDGSYFCSWSCLRRYDGKEGNELEKITREQKEKAVQIALDGGSPHAFLKECGSKAPDKLWYYIKNQLKMKDPEKYELLARGGKKRTVETPKPNEPVIGKVESVTEKDGGIEVKVYPDPKGLEYLPEEIRKKLKESILKPIDQFEYRVTGIDTAIGTFQYFKNNQFLDWTDLNGETVSMNLEEWREFMKVFPLVLQVLEVKL